MNSSNQSESISDGEFISFLEDMGYFDIKIIGDQYCALANFAFTVGLVVDLKENGYGRRYCYENYLDAKTDLNEWDGDDHPSGPWLKCKGFMNGEALDIGNPKAPKLF